MTEIRDAAALILCRDEGNDAKVLMGKRSAQAVFMPNMYVFPGGRVDPEDASATSTNGLSPAALRALGQESALSPATLLHTARREVQEETGLTVGEAPKITFLLRAITPKGLARRFDTRFFLTSATSITSDLDDFSGADGELSDIRWINLTETSAFKMPSVTRFVLNEVTAAINGQTRPGVPFLKGGVEETVSYL